MTTEEGESTHFSPLADPKTYDVFLSFRGDIRYDVADWFYRELVREGYNTFRDVDEIPTGKEIEAEIKKAIGESKVAVILLSPGFASSPYCMDELAEFMELLDVKKLEVLPVFYQVDPDKMFDKEGSKGIYSAAFEKRQEALKGLEGKNLEDEKESIERHKSALRQVATIAARVHIHGYLSSSIKKVLKEVNRMVERSVLRVTPNRVGIEYESLLEDINEWVQNGPNPIGLIYGPAGIGKRTIANEVSNNNYIKFDCRVFLDIAGETMKQTSDIVRLQKHILSQIKRNTKFPDFSVKDEGAMMIKRAISSKTVLIVLFGVEVDQLDQLDDMILRKPEWIKKENKIIITSKNENLLEDRPCEKFGVKPLGNNEDFELFCLHAFGRPIPFDGTKAYNKGHISTALQYCCGFPSAIKVFGLALNNMSPSKREDALGKPEDIGKKVLKNIIDSLEDRDKKIFLDTAVKDGEYVDAKVKGHDCYYEEGIERLRRLNLVTIDKGNKVMMPQPIRDFGREIAGQQPEVTGSGIRSRTASRATRDQSAATNRTLTSVVHEHIGHLLPK